MTELERIVTVLKPTEAFHNWLMSLPDADSDLTLEDLRNDCTALLIPAFDSPEEADEYLESICEDVFITELEGWCEDESQWPENLSYELFEEWFDVEHHSMVYDLDDEMDDDDEDDFDDEEDFEDADSEEADAQ